MCGVVWCGVVWCGVVWCGVVWCGVEWCGVEWCGVVPVVDPGFKKGEWLGWSKYSLGVHREEYVKPLVN